MANGEFLNYMNQSQKNEMEGICEEVVRKLVLGSSKRLMNPQIVVPTNEITSSNSVPFPGRHEIASCSFFTIDPADEKASNHIFRNITSDSFLLRRPPELKKILKDLRVQNHNMGLQVTPEKDAFSAVLVGANSCPSGEGVCVLPEWVIHILGVVDGDEVQVDPL